MTHAISAPTVRATDKPRRLTYHHVVNLERVRAGLDDTHHTLCGRTFAAKCGILASDTPAAQRATWIKCKDCDSLEALQDVLKAREELALTIGRQVLARLEAQEAQA